MIDVDYRVTAALVTSIVAFAISLLNFAMSIIVNNQNRNNNIKVEKIKFELLKELEQEKSEASKELERLKSNISRKVKILDDKVKAHITALEEIITAIQQIKDTVRLIVNAKYDYISSQKAIEQVQDAHTYIRAVFAKQMVHLSSQDHGIAHEAKNISMDIESLVVEVLKSKASPLELTQTERADIEQLRSALTDLQGILIRSISNILLGVLSNE